MPPLHIAIKNNHTELAGLLLFHGAQVDIKDWRGDTLLHKTLKEGNTKAAQFLLQHGANIEIINDYGTTPLHTAAVDGNTKVVQFLLSHGAKIDSLDNYGRTPLGTVESSKHPETAQLIKDWPHYQRSTAHQRKGILAFCMAQHQRLGENSSAHVLPLELYRYIGQFIIPEYPHTIKQIHDIAEQECKTEQEREQQNKKSYYCVIQ